MKSAVAFQYDADLRERDNRSGRNHWHEYVKEICDQLGLTADPIPRSQMEERGSLAGYAALIVGRLAAEDLPGGAQATLWEWVRDGGVLIAFATEGLDNLFGNECASVAPQPTDDFTPAARFALRDDPLTRGIHSYLQPEQKLLAFSDLRNVRPKESEAIADLFDPGGGATGFAAITRRRIGSGQAFYFAFDVAKTVWVLHQGRPVDKDYDGDGYYRMSDAVVIRGNSIEVMYADEILFLLQNMIGLRHVPMIHQLPPAKDGIPGALFYWGGDDEAVDGAQVASSNFMREMGLPYHLNIMPQGGRFHLTDEEARRIEANGHELSLHFNFIDGYKHPLHFTREDIKKQMEMFVARFGRPPVCSVFHWCLWTGWAEPAMWISEFGGKADNCRIHSPSPPLNPVNLLGFAFGTAFPFHIYCDHRHQNKRLDFLAEPITAYEVGYPGEGSDFPIIHKCVDIAAAYHLTLNMFYHPPNVARRENCRQAIREALRYIAEKGIVAVHMGNDELCEWWNDRSKAAVADLEVAGDRLRCRVASHGSMGVIVKAPLGGRKASEALCDGAIAMLKNEERFGQNWAYVAVPSGAHRIEIRLL